MITKFDIFKTYDHIPVNGNIDKILKYIELVSKNDKYNTPQFSFENTKNFKKSKEFLKYLDKISEYTYIDELKGIARQSVDLDLKDIINNVKNSYLGIKVVKNPIGKINYWEKWEEGYIEGYCRMHGKNIEGDLFVFCYIKMKFLKDILEKFKEDLILL
jgi:hypothetical protein